MKRLFALLLALMMTIGIMVGCSSTDATNTPEPTVEKVEEPAPAPDVEITSYMISTDYEDKPCVIVVMSWTNTSDSADMFSTTYNISAFQEGIGLEKVYFLNNDEENQALLDATMTEIKPGTTLTVAEAFILRNETAIIDIEVDEWISFDDKILITTTVDPAK